MLRVKVRDLGNPATRATIERVAGLVASIQGVEFDADQGEASFVGDPDEHLLLISLRNEGVDAAAVHEAPEHPLESGLSMPPHGIDLADIPPPDPAGMGDGLPQPLDPAVKG